MLRARTSPKALRAVGESEEKLTGWNTPPAVRKTKGLRNSREEPAHLRWKKEAEGRAKGQTQPEKPPPPTRQTGPGSYIDFRRPDLRPAARAGAAERKGTLQPGRVCPSP